MLETKILTVSLHPMVIGKRLKQAESECGVAARYRIVVKMLGTARILHLYKHPYNHSGQAKNDDHI